MPLAVAASKPLSRNNGITLVSNPNTALTANVKATVSVQNFRPRTAFDQLSPGSTASVVRAAARRAGLRIHSNVRGKVSSSVGAAMAMNPARQSQLTIAQVSSGGNTEAASPVPDNTIANASPRLRSNHSLTRCDHVTCNVPTPANASKKKPTYSCQSVPRNNVKAIYPSANASSDTVVTTRIP